MEGYELTDRGKIALTLVLVVLLLILPSIVFTYCALTGQAEDAANDPDAKTSAVSPSTTPIPDTTESPPPQGGGFNPPVISPPGGNGDQDGQGSTDGQGAERPPGYGQSVVDPVEGTLSFLFFPEMGDTLDDETSSMLDEFLSFPKNTSDSIVAVETPRLSSVVSAKFVKVIVGALGSRGIEENRIAYITNSGVPLDDGSFTVSFSYITRRPK